MRLSRAFFFHPLIASPESINASTRPHLRDVCYTKLLREAARRREPKNSRGCSRCVSLPRVRQRTNAKIHFSRVVDSEPYQTICVCVCSVSAQHIYLCVLANKSILCRRRRKHQLIVRVLVCVCVCVYLSQCVCTVHPR